MANTGTIQQFGQSTNGKPKVQVNGQWFFLGKADMSTAQVGDTITYESRSSNFNGRDLWFIEKWGKAPATTNGVHAQPPAQTRAVTAHPSGMSEGERLCFISPEHLPIVSNTVANAIASGLIKDRVELGLWVVAIRNAVLGVTERQPGEDDE